MSFDEKWRIVMGRCCYDCQGNGSVYAATGGRTCPLCAGSGIILKRLTKQETVEILPLIIEGTMDGSDQPCDSMKGPCHTWDGNHPHWNDCRNY